MKPFRTERLLLALSVSILLAAPAFSRGETLEGRWLLDFDRADGRLQLTMQRTSPRGHWNSSSSFSAEDFRGLSRPRAGGAVAARFEMVRDAGTIRFEGQLDESGGSGRFQFTPSSEFEGFWKGLGNGALSADEAFAFTMHDVGRKFVEDLRTLGYDRIPADGLISLRIHGASPEFVRDLKSLGYDHIPVDGLVSMRIHGVSPEYVRGLQDLGYRRIPVDSLVSMRIHGVSIEFARSMKERYGEISADELVSKRIHGSR
jgi:hypothetical protein